MATKSLQNNEVYINGRFLTQNITGVQRFAYEIAQKLIEYRKDLIFIIPAGSTINPSYNIRNWNIVNMGRLKDHAWEQIELPKFLKKRGSPLLVNFCSTAPLRYKNQVVTIHDLAFKHGNWHSFFFRAFYNFLLPRIAKVSKHVITVSEFSKNDIISSYKIDHNKISVVYGAVFKEDSANKPSEDFIAKLESQLDEKDFILSVGSIDPRKNIKNTIKAFLEIKDQHKLKLMFIGGYNRSFNKDHELDILIESNKSEVKFFGYVTDDELRILYSKAKFFIYPSLFEGFGLPPLEAMYYGRPVIVSNVTSLPEVCGDAALYCDPKSIKSIKSQMEILIADPNLANDMIIKGHAQVKKFSFQKSAIKMSEIIDVNNHRR